MRVDKSCDVYSVVIGLYMGAWVLYSGAGYGLNFAINIAFLYINSCFIILSVYKKESYKSYKFGFAVLMLMFFSISVVSLVRESFSANYFVKSVLWLLPITVLFNLSNLKISHRVFLKSWFYSGLALNLLFTFFVASFDYRIGKFYADIQGFEISSNSLSIYLIFSVVLPGVLLYKKLSWFLWLTPFIHFSKSHIGIYLFSLISGLMYEKGKIIWLVISFLISVFVLVVIGEYAAFIKELVPVGFERSLGKLIILCEFVNNLILKGEVPEFLLLITSVGDGLRASIYESAFNNLSGAWPLGMNSSEIEVAFRGYDFHNMLFFFYYQNGPIGLLLYLLLFIYSLCSVKTNRGKFFMFFTCSYLFSRGLFISIDPYRLSIVLLVLVFIFREESAFE